MGVFEFVAVIVLISTIGKVVTNRQGRRSVREASVRPKEIAQLNDSMSELSSRLQKLEEERDFCRALLEAPDRKAKLTPPTSEGAEPTGAPRLPDAPGIGG